MPIRGYPFDNDKGSEATVFIKKPNNFTILLLFCLKYPHRLCIFSSLSSAIKTRHNRHLHETFGGSNVPPIWTTNGM